MRALSLEKNQSLAVICWPADSKMPSSHGRKELDSIICSFDAFCKTWIGRPGNDWHSGMS
jgi:hypothetical protein